jgi:hypothetical protein
MYICRVAKSPKFRDFLSLKITLSGLKITLSGLKITLSGLKK